MRIERRLVLSAVVHHRQFRRKNLVAQVASFAGFILAIFISQHVHLHAMSPTRLKVAKLALVQLWLAMNILQVCAEAILVFQASLAVRTL